MKNVISYEVDDTFTSGTSLQGYLYGKKYDDLIRLLGEPTHREADPYEKVQVEWCLRVKAHPYFQEDDYDPSLDYDTEEVTIYNWKTQCVPLDEYDWHIGGKSYLAKELLDEIFERDMKPEYNYND